MKPMETGLARWRNHAVVAIALVAVLWSGATSAQSSGGPLSFFDNIFTGSVSKGSQTAPSGTSTQAQSAPGANGAPPWSGEDGASGHPLMTAAAIREAAANFDSCVAGMWGDAARRISQQNFELSLQD